MTDVVWGRDIDEILSAGLKLDSIGSDNWALGKRLALGAIVKLGDLGHPIAGGDVFVRSNDGVEPIYADWYCSRKNNEAKSEYVSRSVREALDFVRDYPDDEAMFSIVPALIDVQ